MFPAAASTFEQHTNVQFYWLCLQAAREFNILPNPLLRKLLCALYIAHKAVSNFDDNDTA